jgi:hypothetical protein
MNIMNTMNIMKYLLLLVPSICVSIPMKPFLYDNDIKPTNYIIENNIQESKGILQNEEDKQFWIDLYEEENTVMNDIKDKQFWEDFQKSLYKYDNLLTEAKQTGEYYDIDFDEMNRGIMEELCEEMDGIEMFCDRNTKTFELTILEKEDKPLDIEKIIKNFEDTPYKIIDY